MPPFETELAIILRTFDDDSHIAEALFFPEVSRYGNNTETLKRAIVKNSVRILEAENLNRLFMRTAPDSIENFELNLRLEPAVKNLRWRDPFNLRLDVVRWKHGEHAHIAFIPALGIEVVSNKLDDLVASVQADGPSMLERHARAELIRRGVTSNVRDLIMLERTTALSVLRVRSMATIRTPKQVAASKPEEKKTSALEDAALDLTKQKLSPAYEIENAVAQLAEALMGKAARSVLLVGKAGAGKTALFNELVRTRAALGLESVPFWATSGSRLVAGMSGYGMWQERCDALWREAEQKNAVIHFGNLVELMDTGKSEHNSQGLASFFRQRFMHNRALAVMECTPSQIPLIEREDPSLLKVFLQFNVEEPTAEAGRKILQQFAEGFARESLVTSRKKLRQLARLAQSNTRAITAAGLETLDRLHRRYAGYSAYPGRPLRFLRGLLLDRANAYTEEPPIGAHEVTESFAKETGLPPFLLDDTVAYDSSQTLDWFAERVIGQQQAVTLIVDLLATVKAGLTRPRRPIASLLFAGPTGVGKTELAKSLARFFFGDEGRMARFDMSEYADALAVTRLVGSAIAGEGTLTARIREQPFSVVLFDEFEKAHPSFFDLLLQTLGEGRLTDGRGRLADFSNTIVIMTSNLGAERFRRSRPGFLNHASSGEADDSEQKYLHAAQKHFARAVEEFLRPEIFNRIDHIVPFVPLARETVARIAERELRHIEQRDGIQLRGVSLRVSKEAIESFSRRGYDTRYGARPLKRLIERELLLPLATELNLRPPAKHACQLIAGVSVESSRIRVHLEEHAIRRKALSSGPHYDETTQAAHAERLGELRRRVQRLEHSPAVIEMRNSIWRLKDLERRIAETARQMKVSRQEGRRIMQGFLRTHLWERLPEYIKIAEALTRLSEATAIAEDEALLALYGRQTHKAQGEASSAAQKLQSDLYTLLGQLFDVRFTHPNRITLAIYSENKQSLFELSRGYFNAAASAKMNITLGYYTAVTERSEEKKTKMFDREVSRQVTQKPEMFLSAAPENTTGIIFGIEGRSAQAAYQSEHGLHAFVEEKTVHNLFVHASEESFEEYAPPSSLERRGSITPANQGERRRVYQRTEGYIEDRVLDQRREWRSGSEEGIRQLGAILKEFIKLQHEIRTVELIAG